MLLVSNMNKAEYAKLSLWFLIKRHFWHSFRKNPKAKFETPTEYARRKHEENSKLPKHLWPHLETWAQSWTPITKDEIHWMVLTVGSLCLGWLLCQVL